MVRQYGFTLIELMVVLAIIGLLAAIGYPAYNNHVQDSNRASAQGRMMALATAMESYRAQNLGYGGAKLEDLSNLDSNNQYDVTFIDPDGNEVTTMPAGAQSFEILAKPKSGTIMDGTGAMQVNNRGQTCWKKSDDAGCDYASDPGWSDQ